MRDPKRIKPILELIEKIWTKNPDLRLCQLIGNCFEAGDNYYKEDNILEEKLKKLLYMMEKPAETIPRKKKIINRSHGSPYDRGSADSYYNRPKNPHKWLDPLGQKVEKLTDPDEIEAYNLGYDE